MKKIFLFFFIVSWLFGQSQELSVIKDGSNYLLVKNQRSESTIVDTTQNKVLTIITISNDLIPVCHIKSDFNNTKIIHNLVADNYRMITDDKGFIRDSVINSYNVFKPWLKTSIIKTYTIRYETGVIYCHLEQSPAKTYYNFEYLLLVLTLMFIIYLDYSTLKKLKKHSGLIAIIGIFAAVIISGQYVDIIRNIAQALFMTTMFLLGFYLILKMGSSYIWGMIASYSIFSGYILHNKHFSILCFLVACLTMIVIMLLIKFKKIPILRA